MARFQFNLSRLFLATTLMAIAAGFYLAATRTQSPSSMALFLAACACCGASVGSLFHRTRAVALLGLFAGMGLGLFAGIALLIYAIETSEL